MSIGRYLFNTYKRPVTIHKQSTGEDIRVYMLEKKGKNNIYTPVDNEISNNITKEFYCPLSELYRFHIEDTITKIGDIDISDNPYIIKYKDVANSHKTGFARIITENTKPLTPSIGGY